MTVRGAKINPQLPGLQKGVEAERNSVRLQSPVRSIMTFTFSMWREDCRQKEFTKFIFWHLLPNAYHACSFECITHV